MMVDPGPLIPMSDYNNDATPGFRVLNCFDCFSARGKMCIDKEYRSLFYKTQSSNEAKGICCKPDHKSGYCDPNNSELICSMPSFDVDPNSLYKQVLSNGKLNYQMFAFCPMTDLNRDICGTGRTDTNMSLSASSNIQTISTNKMRHIDHKKADQTVREHHICYYQITANSAKSIPNKS